MPSAIEESEPHLLAVGKIAARWATLDVTLSLVLGTLIRDLSAGASIYFAISSQGARLDVILAALRTAKLDEVKKEAFRSDLQKLQKLWKRRNALLHSPVGRGSPSDEPYSLIRTTPLREVYIRTEPVTLKQLREHADAVDRVAERLTEMCIPPTWAKTPP